MDHAPDQIEAYIRLADLLRTRLDKPAEVAKVLDKMVELNPKSYRAYLERGNQRRLGRFERGRSGHRPSPGTGPG